MLQQNFEWFNDSKNEENPFKRLLFGMKVRNDPRISFEERNEER